LGDQNFKKKKNGFKEVDYSTSRLISCYKIGARDYNDRGAFTRYALL
jgi:hypothetical protein